MTERPPRPRPRTPSPRVLFIILFYFLGRRRSTRPSRRSRRRRSRTKTRMNETGVPGGGLLRLAPEQQPHLRRVPLSAVEKRDRVVDERRLVRRRKAEDAVDDVVQERLLAIRPVRRLDDRDVGRPREVRAARRHRPAAGRVPRPERDRGVAADAGTVRRRAHAKGALHLCGNQNFTARSESSRRPPHHRCDACSMAWRCRSLAARRSQDGTRRTG